MLTLHDGCIHLLLSFFLVSRFQHLPLISSFISSWPPPPAADAASLDLLQVVGHLPLLLCSHHFPSFLFILPFPSSSPPPLSNLHFQPSTSKLAYSILTTLPDTRHPHISVHSTYSHLISYRIFHLPSTMQLISPSSVIFHRVGGLDLTTRFKDNELPAISDNDWKDGAAAVEISFSSGSALQSAVVVREFIPRYGDVTGRRYTDSEGNHQWINLPSYGLVDPSAYLSLIKQEIPKQALSWAATQGAAHQEALRLVQSGEAPELETLLQYDFARYQKTRSAFITGPARLGIHALPGGTGLMGSQAPLPRMITAQCDIVLNTYLTELLKQLFGDSDSAILKRFLATSSMDTHVAYVALRVITEGSVWVLLDKQRRDLENNISDRSLQRQLQDSLNSLVHLFSSKRFGMNYNKLVEGIPNEAAPFYSAIQDEANSSPSLSWNSSLYWLPTLANSVKIPFEPKTPF
ncbi:hypothetical protein F503_02266 [Ophiostoma piceae UAMH 11346]|uniref:Uncharacterized protein n=1 Tax=Ophiostoma piceae (strain UAMH 11346) TaxID=1262450 RepID=S3BY98_OPHP1|nr:hypothetical protein F503_02266 [Ophiostoma piceae UAMH 11346]